MRIIYSLLFSLLATFIHNTCYAQYYPIGIIDSIHVDWEYDDDGYWVYVSECYIDNMSGASGAITIPDRIEEYDEDGLLCEVLIPVIVGSEAFKGGNQITSISLPNTIRNIGWGAFMNCTSLEYIDLPNQITEIPASAFVGCANLKSINIPESVTSIGKNAFEACESLTTANLPDLLTYLGNSAFERCNKLETINIPNGLTIIEKNTFKGCNELKAINLPNALTSIGESAFWECGIESIIIPKSVRMIDRRAFRLAKLASVYFQNPVDSIAALAFDVSDSLNIYIERLSDWFNTSKVGTIGAYRLFVGGKEVVDLEIPSSIGHVPDYCFSKCLSLKNIKFNSGLKSIGNCAFGWSDTIPEIVIPNSVTDIGTDAFCGPVKDIIIGNGIKNIGIDAFQEVTEAIYITAPEPPNWNIEALSLVAHFKQIDLVVQNNAARNLYENQEPWRSFKNIYTMIEIDSLLTDNQVVDIKVGEQLQLNIDVYPDNASLKHVFWESTNPDLASVDRNGVVTVHGVNETEYQLNNTNDSSRQVKIIASTLYSGGPVVEFQLNINHSIAAVDDITADGEGGMTAALRENPVSSQASLRVTGSEQQARYQVFSIQGTSLGENVVPADGQYHEMSRTPAAAGVYLVRVFCGTECRTLKMIVR